MVTQFDEIFTIFTMKRHRGVKIILTQIWGGSGHPVRRSTSKSKICHFLLSVGDAMLITEYCHVDVFRPGVL